MYYFLFGLHASYDTAMESGVGRKKMEEGSGGGGVVSSQSAARGDVKVTIDST